jgi:hypothetical protein
MGNRIPLKPIKKMIARGDKLNDVILDCPCLMKERCSPANSIRASTAETPVASDFTSIQAPIHAYIERQKSDKKKQQITRASTKLFSCRWCY